MKATAFVPGHVSGFFEPVYHAHDFCRTGSRGAGINLSLGVVSQVSVGEGTEQKIVVRINEKVEAAPVTCLAIQYLIGKNPLSVTVDMWHDLPVSQGFGMSAAGAFSASLAIASLLKLPRDQALVAAHYAEVQSRTGLGDVVASCFGGVEIRRKAGLPPWGVVEHIPGDADIVLCVIGKKVETKHVLSDPKKISEIIVLGQRCVDQLLKKPSLEHLFELSYFFTCKSGLADKKVLGAIQAVEPYGMASMCMLGNSVFARGRTTELMDVLSGYGEVFCCSIDKEGARLINER